MRPDHACLAVFTAKNSGAIDADGLGRMFAEFQAIDTAPELAVPVWFVDMEGSRRPARAVPSLIPGWYLFLANITSSIFEMRPGRTSEAKNARIRWAR